MDSVGARKKQRAVAIWLWIGVGMTVFQIALGGITRLTGSGLSITEWNVVTGTLPPLSAADWQSEFLKYQQTPQFQLLNMEFTLGDFKFIYFWEWFHRLWARLIGLVFAAGFIYFLITKSFKKTMVTPLIGLFLLGGLQGAIGWIMVASGLTGDAVYVKPTRLALHFIFALILLSYTTWIALQHSISSKSNIEAPQLKKWLLWGIPLVIVQLMYGALMAGHKAATAAPTWPDINGAMVPDGLFFHQPALINFIDNTILVHFIHRGIAYLLVIGVLFWTWKAMQLKNVSNTFSKWRWFPAALILVQLILGIASVLFSTQIVPNTWGLFEWAAQLHQLVGMAFLLSLISLWYLMTPRQNELAA